MQNVTLITVTLVPCFARRGIVRCGLSRCSCHSTLNGSTTQPKAPLLPTHCSANFSCSRLADVMLVAHGLDPTVFPQFPPLAANLAGMEGLGIGGAVRWVVGLFA